MHRLSAFVICVLLVTVPIVAAAEDWPTYRGDRWRSGITAESLDAPRLRLLWTFRSPHPPQTAWEGPAKWDAYAGIRGLTDMRDYDHSFPVAVAGNSVFFASSADDSVRCLDSRDGSVKWTFTTNAPVRVAPTYHDGRLFFGSDDGQAYCLNARNGRLIWTYRPPVR